MQQPVHILCGPTASGKSARALDIAQETRAVIINADAMQVYSELHILTARPTPNDEARVPHALYGVLPASEACSAARWLELARAQIKEAWRQEKLPIVTGGTGLYLKALTDGLSPIPDISPHLRQEAASLYAEQGEQALQQRDPAMAARLKAGDTQRHTRALEVWLATGKSLLYWQGLPRDVPFPQARFTLECVTPDREMLYRRCDARFGLMLAQGALKEVEDLLTLGLSPELPSMRIIGVPELASFLRGESTMEEATRRAQQATRNYAKRQLTWFRNQLPRV